ncbi:MAG: outer membrane beta-barrel protein [Bacteroidaceae bacterium]|nr:outer membrane beta-barrel protein [Bacteroidaceae bacterium]
MKKTILTLFALLFVLTSNAQFYAGGRLGWWRDGNSHDKRFTIQPEVGYEWNDCLSFGAVVGFYKDKTQLVKEAAPAGEQNTITRSFEFSPYVRYNVVKAGPVNLFVDGTVGFATSRTASQASRNSFRIGARPGVSVALGKSFSAVAHIGFVGYADSETGLYRDGAGIDLSGNELTFGVFYRF